MGESRPAARKGDSTAHGGSIIEGAKHVEVNHRPAAAFHNATQCPRNDPPPPHVGGKIVLADGLALFVLIEKKPGGVLMSNAPCDGAPGVLNQVVTGSANVLYGVTTMLGPYKVTEMDGKIYVGDYIVIVGNSDFQAKALGDLATMMSNEDGQMQLAGLEDPSSSSVTTIQEGPYIDPNGGSTVADNDTDAMTQGKGSGSTVSYNPDGYENDPRNKTSAPSDCSLYHELGHANEARDGTSSPPGESQGRWGDSEDQRVINGQSDGQSEQSYRDHRGVAPRSSHQTF